MDATKFNQLRSPLFRLPRELRDAIYEYYAFEEQGYFYDFRSSRMLCFAKGDGEELQSGRLLGLMLSCKKAAEEFVSWQGSPDRRIEH